MKQRNGKLRVVFVLPALAPGGAERVLIQLMNGLDPGKFIPTLLNVLDSDALRPLIRDDIQVVDMKAGSVPKSIPALFRQLRQFRPDVVVSTMAHMNFAILLLRPLFPRTRFIVREAITPSFLLQSKPQQAWLIRLLYRCLYPLATHVIAPAQLVLQEFSTDLGMRLRRPVWLPNPVATEGVRSYGASARPKIDLNFIAAGRLHPQKGFDALITALKDFDPGCTWSLFILGDGTERKNLEKLIRENGLEKNVKLSGHVITPWPYYASADAFILPSLWEGLPNVVLESLACGTKVIALKSAGGIGEIAALAPDAVQVVDNLPQMIEAMKAVKPSTAEKIRPSLLPDVFNQDDVNKRFAKLLRGD